MRKQHTPLSSAIRKEASTSGSSNTQEIHVLHLLNV